MRSSVTVAGLLFLIGLSSSAAAMQGRNGEDCRSWSGPSCSIGYSACENHGSTTMHADCTIARLGSSNSGGWVGVRDYNSSTDATCRLCSIRYVGTSRYQYCTGWQPTSGSSASVIWLSFSSVTTYDIYSNYYYECEVPPASGTNYSGILAYYLNES